jgi:hypothetical protein
MRVPQFAKRPLAALALAALLAGCGGDSTAPDSPFDPAGTTADIGAIEASFESQAMAGYLAASEAIGSTLGESPAAMAVRAAPTKALVRGRPGARRYADKLARIYAGPGGSMRPASGAAAIEEQYLGVTFVYNAETDAYEPSDLPGAPANGVRFIVYSVNPISGEPTEPLVEVGYADIEVTEGTNSGSVRVELVSDEVTYLDYTVAGTGTTTAITLSISGFVSNGDDRVNFDLDNRLSSSSVEVDYTLAVPTRGNFRIEFEGEAAGSTVTSTLEARGPHGTVTISGTQSSTSASFEVHVNGDLFATIDVSEGSQPVISGADGEPLSQAEMEALQAVFAVFLGGFDFFEDLLDPLGAI